MKIRITEEIYNKIQEVGEFNPVTDIDVNIVRQDKMYYWVEFEIDGIKYDLKCDYDVKTGLIEVYFTMSTPDKLASFSRTPENFKGVFKKMSIIVQQMQLALAHFQAINPTFGFWYTGNKDSGVKREKFYNWIISKVIDRVNPDKILKHKVGMEDVTFIILDYEAWIEHLNKSYINVDNPKKYIELILSDLM